MHRYHKLKLLLALVLCFACNRHSAPSYQAVVVAGYTGKPGATLDGAPTFATIGEALAAVPEVNTAPFVIFVRKGRYYEKLCVDKAHVRLLGESRDETIPYLRSMLPAIRQTLLAEPMARGAALPCESLRQTSTLKTSPLKTALPYYLNRMSVSTPLKFH